MLLLLEHFLSIDCDKSLSSTFLAKATALLQLSIAALLFPKKISVILCYSHW